MIAKAALGSAAASIAVTGLTFVSGVVIARVLGPEDRGHLGLVVFWPTAVLALLQFPWTETLVISLSKRSIAADPASRAALIGWALRTALVVALCTWPILAATVLIAMSGQDPVLPVLSLGFGTILLVCGSLSRVQVGILQSDGRLQVLNASSIVLPLAYTLLALGVAALGLGLSGFVAAQAVAIVLSFVQRNFCIRHVPRTSAPVPQIGQVVNTGLSIFGLTLVSALCGQADRLLFMPTNSAAQIGVYVVALSFAGVLPGVLSSSLMSVALPALAARDQAGKESAGLRLLRLTTAASVISALLTASMAPFVVPLLLGSAFHEAGIVSSVLALAMASLPLTQALQQILLSVNKQSGILRGQIAFLLVLPASYALLLYADAPWPILPALCAAHVVQTLVLGVAFQRSFPKAPATWAVPRAAAFVELIAIVLSVVKRHAGMNYGRP